MLIESKRMVFKFMSKIKIMANEKAFLIGFCITLVIAGFIMFVMGYLLKNNSYSYLGVFCLAGSIICLLFLIVPILSSKDDFSQPTAV